jgi:uncharacterized protein YjbI with pentapeptide repeats
MDGRVTTSIFAAAGVLLLASDAAAFDEGDLARLRETGSCRACDLSAADLHLMNLKQADLSGADLTGAQMDTANLSGASLRGADLSRATGSFIRLTGADLSGARLVEFTASYDQNFRGAILRGADLSRARLNSTFWHEADISGAILSGADLTEGYELTQEQLDRACGDDETKLPSPSFSVKRC